MVAAALAVYVGILLLAGYRSIPALWHSLTLMPEQGTYGGFKFSNLATALLGFASSVFPVLPDDFSGVRSLLSQLTSGSRFYLSTVVLPLVVALALAFFISLLRLRSRFPRRYRFVIGLGLAVFGGALVSSLFWDPYHPKLWMYSNIGLWLMAAGFVAYQAVGIPRRLDPKRSTPGRQSALVTEIVFAVALFSIVSMNLARRITRAGPNPRWATAQDIARIANTSNSNLVIGGWEDEFDYLTLLVPEARLISLPDFLFEQGRDSSRFARRLSEIVADRQSRAGRVYVVNVFNRTQSELETFYVRRLRFSPALSWLNRQRPNAQAVWRDSLTGIGLYELK